MTARTNARFAGAAYLVYLVAGIASMAAASYPPARDVLNTVVPFCAVALGVTLYALTRHVDEDLALLGMALRLLEAAPGNGELFFAVGNAIFCWLLLRGRLIPSALAGLGLGWSILLAALLLLQAGGMLGGRTDWSSPVTWFVWLPLLIFELAFAGLLLLKGVAIRPRPAA